MDVETFVTAKEVFLRKLSLNLDQIEIDTWGKEREIRVTASNFGRIYKLRATTATAKTVESLLCSTFKGNSHTNYGQQSEEKAVKCFEINKSIKTERCGLFISKQFPYLAASPDRVLDDRSALVEIKCPSKSQDLSPEEAVRKKNNHILYIDRQRIETKKNHDYYFQVQGQMLVTSISQVYFVV
ncbi:hypothetical protein Zmor_006348 [Zophobas morio]|uniref:YqaJ viral recombinase domain-containing protein n=1 Tax=Zophobas morio TaxID=2755281 RepID=A0AA38IPU3_9CUCU|nr:hypothetical protein Zmor_006348 [Zophobas morio]